MGSPHVRSHGSWGLSLTRSLAVADLAQDLLNVNKMDQTPTQPSTAPGKCFSARGPFGRWCPACRIHFDTDLCPSCGSVGTTDPHGGRVQADDAARTQASTVAGLPPSLPTRARAPVSASCAGRRSRQVSARPVGVRGIRPSPVPPTLGRPTPSRRFSASTPTRPASTCGSSRRSSPACRLPVRRIRRPFHARVSRAPAGRSPSVRGAGAT